MARQEIDIEKRKPAYHRVQQVVADPAARQRALDMQFLDCTLQDQRYPCFLRRDVDENVFAHSGRMPASSNSCVVSNSGKPMMPE